MALLIADSVSYNYPDHPRAIVRGLSLRLEAGRLIRIAGRNGSGKTTALRLLAGELEPTTGRILRTQRTRSLYLDQKASAILAPDLSVIEHLRTFRRGDRMVELEAEIARFGLPLEKLLPKFAGQLSGGERQLFALLCALGGSYNVLLLDEFTSHLDDRSEAAAFELVSLALKSGMIGAILVSHRPVPLHVDEVVDLSNKGEV